MFSALMKCVPIIIAFIFVLHIIGVKKQIVILTGFALFGMTLGLQVALNPPYDGLDTFETVATYWGDGIYELSIDHFGDPHSAWAHNTIPWFLRIPEVYFFAPAIIFCLTGLMVQILFSLFNRIKKVPSININIISIPTRLIIILLIASFGISSSIVYAQHDQDDEYPTQLMIIPAGEGETPSQHEEWETWEIITSYEIESLSFDSEVAKIGHEFMVTGMVKNTGQEKAIVTIELEVDGVSASNEIALLPGESKPIIFFILFPKEGTYLVKMGSLSEYITVVD